MDTYPKELIATVPSDMSSMESVIRTLEDEDFKVTLITSLNKNINIPIISEETEASILEAIYGTVLDSLRQAHHRALQKNLTA